VIYDVEVNGRTRRIEIQREGTAFIVTVDGRRQAADVAVVNGVWSLVLSDEDGPRRSYEIAFMEHAGSGELTVHVNGRVVSAVVASGRGAWARRGHEAAAGVGPATVKAPMPGKVVKVLVKKGDTVTARQGVAVVEAMKMENELRAPKAGTVIDVQAVEGTTVEAGATLIGVR
jgi:biotin carboxyl carrier protein